jgi:Sulfakinin family
MQQSVVAIFLVVSAMILTVMCGTKDEHDNMAKVTFDGLPDLPPQYMELQKRAGGDKWNKGFNDYHHLRFGRGDPALTDEVLSPFYRYPPYSSNLVEKRASFGSDYNHLRFGRRVPSFTDYGHLRFG